MWKMNDVTWLVNPMAKDHELSRYWKDLPHLIRWVWDQFNILFTTNTTAPNIYSPIHCTLWTSTCGNQTNCDTELAPENWWRNVSSLYTTNMNNIYLLYISQPFPNIIKWFSSGNIVGQDDSLVKMKKILVKYHHTWVTITSRKWDIEPHTTKELSRSLRAKSLTCLKLRQLLSKSKFRIYAICYVTSCHIPSSNHLPSLH